MKLSSHQAQVLGKGIKQKQQNGITATQEQRTYTFTHRFQTKAKSLKYVLSIFSILLFYLLRTYATSCELNVSFKNNSLVQLIHQKKWIFMSYSSFLILYVRLRVLRIIYKKAKLYPSTKFLNQSTSALLQVKPCIFRSLLICCIQTFRKQNTDTYVSQIKPLCMTY